MDDILKNAKNCRHFAMCKIDFLGTGVCASGLERHYVSFYPEGRMDVYAALAEKAIPVTEQCVEIADSCDLCGKCDHQCYFVTEMRPSKVMAALKDHVAAHIKSGGEILRVKDDKILAAMKAIVGDDWASNDPAIRVTYHHDLCPHVTFKMPEYVVLPNSKEEVSSLVKLLAESGVPYIVRGNGASTHGLAFSEGAVLDLNRMKTMEFDEKNWRVKVGPGVAAFELQREAHQRGTRVHTAEPAALVCANIMTSGLLSTFSTTYGISADNFVDAEFVGRDGTFFSLNDAGAPNLFAFDKSLRDHEAVATCVSISVKLHPVTEDEEGILVPFESLDKALGFARECATRHIGLAIAVLGEEFMATFLAPTIKLAADVKDMFVRKLGMRYLVLLIGDRYAVRAVRDMGYPAIGQKLFRTLFLALPTLRSAKWLDLLEEFSAGEPFSYLRSDQFADLAEAALAPSPAQLSLGIDPDLGPFYEELYSRPEMTDLVWLNTFRILSSRYWRERPCVALVLYLPIDAPLVAEIQGRLQDIGRKHGLKSELGFITPFDNGKRCVWEHDLYYDHHDPDDVARVQQATVEAGTLLDDYSVKTGTIRQVRYVVNQGCCRRENLLYA
jgi:hypothetical protein